MSDEANQALVLANSYLDEVKEVADSFDQVIALGHDEAIDALRTLDLADRQIAVGEAAPLTEPEVDAGMSVATLLKATSTLYRGVINGFSLGRRSEGLRLVQEAISLVDTFPMAYHALAVLHLELGQKEPAVEALRKAVELDPENLEFRKFLDRVESESGTAIKAAAFRGSRRVLGCLVVLGAVGVLGSLMMATVDLGSGLFSLVISVAFWGGLALLYWKVKTR